jgi:HEAT repeat protein
MVKLSPTSQLRNNRSYRKDTRLTQFLALVTLGLCLEGFAGRPCAAQAPPTIQAELRKYGVPETEVGLQLALGDSRPVVRSLAAGELASKREASSVPLIATALAKEDDPLARFNLASALVVLGSRLGNRALTQICDETSQPADRRLDAASRLLDAGDSSCAPSVEMILRSATVASIRVSALLYLARVKVLSAALAMRIHRTLEASLQDPTAVVRGYASECISALGDQAATSDLRVAIEKEPDEETREEMEKSLKSLEKGGIGPLSRLRMNAYYVP